MHAYPLILSSNRAFYIGVQRVYSIAQPNRPLMELVRDLVILMKKCMKPKAVLREADAGLHVPLYVTLTLPSGTIAAYNYSIQTALRR